MGSKKEFEKSDIYATDYFFEYSLPTIDVDVISGYKIIQPDGDLYSYHFDEQSVPYRIDIEGVEIPFTTIEEWYILYQLMPEREQKVLLTENHLSKNGIKHPKLIDRMLQQPNTPNKVVVRTKRLMQSQLL